MVSADGTIDLDKHLEDFEQIVEFAEYTEKMPTTPSIKYPKEWYEIYKKETPYYKYDPPN